MTPNEQVKKQFENEMIAHFNRWFEESDMAKGAIEAIEAWLDEDVIGFEPEDES